MKVNVRQKENSDKTLETSAKKETPTALHVSLDTKDTHESRRRSGTRRGNKRVRGLDYIPVRDDDNDDDDDDDEDDDHDEREAE